MERVLAILAVIYLAVLFSFGGQPATIKTNLVLQEQFSFELERVIDGDTIVGDISFPLSLKLEKQSIRFLDFDAPEIVLRRGMTREQLAKGLAAKKELQEFLKGKSLSIKIKGRDSFGRVLASVFADGESVTDHMVSKGFSKDVSK